METLKDEINTLASHPIYQEFLKIQGVIEDGKMIHNLIIGKKLTIQRYEQEMNAQQEAEQDQDARDYEQVPQQAPRRSVNVIPKMRREDYQQPTQERVQHLERKIAAQVQQKSALDEEDDDTTEESTFDTSVDGMPEDINDLLDDAKEIERQKQLKRK